MNTNLIKELNKFLTGIHMGAATFKDYIEKAQSKELKVELESILTSFKTNEETIASIIQNNGGSPSQSLGVIGTVAEFWEELKLISVDSDLEVCTHAIKAINMGIKGGENFIKENEMEIDDNIMTEVKNIVKDYNNHLMAIEKMKHTFL